MALLALNADVLSSVLDLIDGRDAARLLLASRHAYSIALPRFLSDVSLGGLYYSPAGTAVKQLTAFCDFMLAPALPGDLFSSSARLAALRGLAVMRDAVRVRDKATNEWAVDTTAVSRLASVLAQARNLQRLTLWGPDALFAAHPDLATALASNTLLRTVTLGGDIPPLPILARAFPHVSTLTFVPGSTSRAVPDQVASSSESRSDAEPVVCHWPALDRLDMGVPLPSLASPVRRLDLRNPLSRDAPEATFEAGRELLSRTRPAVHSCSVSSDSAAEELASILDADGVADTMRFLEMHVDRCGSDAEVAQWMTVVADALASVPRLGLLGLSLRPSSASLRPRPFPVTPAATRPPTPAITRVSTPMPTRPSSPHPTRPSSPLLLSVPQLPLPQAQPPADPQNLADIARRLAESAPSLRFVGLQKSTETTQEWFTAHDERRYMKDGAILMARRVERLEDGDAASARSWLWALDRWD